MIRSSGVAEIMEERGSKIHCAERLSWKGNLAVMLAIALLSFYLMSHWIWRPMSPDERNYLGWAMKLYKDGSYEDIEGRPIVKVPPLYVYSLALSFRTFGPNTDAAQAVSLFFGCLGILLSYELGRRLWGWKVGLMASILLLVSAKGEYWRYSNRVLNEIPLGFFILCVVYFLCMYLRRPSWSKAAAVGSSLGLGLLTKEFAVLMLPVAGITLVLARERWPKKLLHMLLALSFLLLVLLPWLIHVTEITGSPLGGIAQRGRGQAGQIIKDTKAWGIRPIEDWADMLTLYDRPAWLCQVAMIAGMAYAMWRFLRKREPEMGIVVLPILVFLGTFGLFVALPLDLRRLVPLFPLYSLLVAILLKRIWEFFVEKAQRLNLRTLASMKLGVALFILFALNSLKPGLVMHKFEPFRIFSSRKHFFLLSESEAAMRCVPSNSTILTNYPSILYFYLQANYPIRTLRTTMETPNPPLLSEMAGLGRMQSLEGDSLLYDFQFMRNRVVMTREFLRRQIEASGADYLIFFRTGHPKAAPKVLEEFFMEHPDEYAPVCLEERYAVYRIVRSR